MNYFEYVERKHNDSQPVCKPSDLVEWPGITVSEGEMTEDMLLELSLMKTNTTGDTQ